MQRFAAILLTLFVAVPAIAADATIVTEPIITTETVMVEPGFPADGPVMFAPIGDATCLGCESCATCSESDIMDVRNYRLKDYRRMFMRGRAPLPHELAGSWRGVNKGLVRMIGYKQFIKEIEPQECVTFGDNIKVHQVSDDILRCCGWEPKIDPHTGFLRRSGSYKVEAPDYRGRFGHGVIFNYRKGGNRKLDPRRMIVDKVVMIDECHLLGRATVGVGKLRVPVGFFVLERVH